MQPDAALDQALHRALAAFQAGRPASALSQAMHYALFPGGARLRPSLALAVASDPAGATGRALAGACALELLHGASLVHDDLPCFDDAATRRHKPSVHRAFGEATAVLAGDALLALSFRAVGDLARPFEPRIQALLADAATALMHGQAQEQGGPVSLANYHQAKTGCLFEAAARTGAIAAGRDEAGWGEFGRHLGAAYQLADDLTDVAGENSAGKDGGKDAVLGRPNFALRHGVAAAVVELRQRLAALEARLEQLRAPHPARAWLAHFSQRLRPAPATASTAAAAGTRRAVVHSLPTASPRPKVRAQAIQLDAGR